MAVELFTPPTPPTPFVGRTNELEWLRGEANKRDLVHGRPIVVSGSAGIGKTALVAKFLAPGPAVSISMHFSSPDSPRRASRQPIWLSAKTFASDARNFIPEIRRRTDDPSEPWPIIILDGADELGPEQQRNVFSQLFDFKLVRAVVITTRRELDLGLRGERTLHLDGLPTAEAESLLFEASQSEIGPESMQKMLGVADGLPLALKLLAALAKSRSQEELRQLLAGHLYDLRQDAIVPGGKLLAVARPIIISANDAMIAALKKQPKDIYKLTPRQYEELLAELFRDMGYEVKLTKATRDGGKDILAAIETEIGRLLCLIEAKRYREDRKIGVSLIRSLYGTLSDYQATNAMMVTTSSYSKDAHAMQQRHPYQLSLKEYGHVADWIQRYGTNKQGPKG